MALRDWIEPTEEYFREIRPWFKRSYERWLTSVAGALRAWVEK